ncbi:MAG: radical SAM family heme chaperone HemW [Candidatus Acidiferrales bacterium]
MPLGIYIQVPFCQTKCTYCNFHTGVVSPSLYQPYADAVRREIAATEDFCGAPADTVYFGGGTPSLLSPVALAQILDALRARFQLPGASEPAEITLEADPETIHAENSTAWRAGSFNRVSLGAQSFSDAELSASGRLHRRADIGQAVATLRAAGIDNIALDLIAGLPHQTADSWQDSLAQLLEIRPEHVSIYMLEIDEGSRLGRESLAGGARYSAAAIPPDDDIADFYESAGARLAAAGYEHYEISNWALPGRRSRHNLKYWRREPYLGLGAGAHSFDGVSRWANVHDSGQYVSAIQQGTSPRENIEAVTAAQALDEEFFLGLRQLDGIDLARIESAYASAEPARLAALTKRIFSLRDTGLVSLDGPRLRLSPERLTVSSEVLGELLA